MSRRSRRRAACALASVLVFASGCALHESRVRYRSLSRDYARESQAAPAGDTLAFANADALDREALVEAVLRRNPSVASARAAWRAALARYPQETSLDDPMVGYMVGPRSFGSSKVGDAERIEARQAFPVPGSLGLRGAAAVAEAEASASDLAALRIRLAAMTSALYDEYWLAARSLAVNEEHLALVRELRAVATARYESGTAEAQDPLLAELEEAELLHREVEFASAVRIAAHRIALLLHRPDGAEIPPPPDVLPALDVPPAGDDADAVARALETRPELHAADARVAARESGERLAIRNFLPEFALTGGYDTFWEMPDQRPFVGIELNVPLAIGRRRGALEEARAELEMARSERDRVRDELTSEVRIARERFAEADHGLAIVRERMTPPARDRLGAARIGFESGRVGFGDLIEAERALRDAELAEQSAQALLSQRAAELIAALGHAPGLPLPESAAAPTPEGDHHHE
jgi:outer membrane protein TolC